MQVVGTLLKTKVLVRECSYVHVCTVCVWLLEGVLIMCGCDVMVM